MTAGGHAGWYSRGYLPHCDSSAAVQHVAFGQADALPPGIAFESDDHLDAGFGSCLLRVDDIAPIVENALLHSDGERYRLLAWCVMPNHVHVVFEQLSGARLSAVVQSWKSVTAHRINARLGRRGRFWRREYFDRFMRDDGHLARTIAYVEGNPVKAGLVKAPEDWLFSSASRHRKTGCG
ncbi:MAG: transposase [Hyphomonadaceae bacterium]|nr:transposase [Hyphomonadaceae bacterium]